MFGIAMTEIRESGCGIPVKKERVCGIMTPFPDPMLTVAVFLLASSPGDPLCAGVPDVLLEKAIINAGATEIDLKWPPAALSIDTQSRRFFAFRSIGDSSDQYRAVVLDMFSKSWSLTRKEFSTKVAEQNLPAPSRKDWMIVQQDLLERYGNNHMQWFLRGTSSMLVGT